MTKAEALKIVWSMIRAIHGEWCSGDLNACRMCAKNLEAYEKLEAACSTRS